MKQENLTEQQRTTLTNAQAALAYMQRELEDKRIDLTDAQTQLTRITTKLNALEIPGATNKAGSDNTWWGQKVRPYLGDVGTVTNSAARARNIYQLNRN